MDVAMLQQEIQSLPSHLQDRLAAFLIALRMQRDGNAEEVHSRLDDSSSVNWKSWKQVKEDLRIRDSGQND